MRRTFYWLIILAVALTACGDAQSAATSTAAPQSAATAALTPSPVIPFEDGPTIPPPTAAASGESITLLCTTAEDWCAVEMAAAQAQTGIAITYEHHSSGDALELLRSLKDAPKFDVWYGGPADAYAAAKGEGLLQPYASPSAIRIPLQFKDADEMWTGMYIGSVAFCVNPAELAKLGVAAPQTWQDLLDPKLKGHIAMSHPATSGTAYTALWTQVTLNGGDQDKALAYFKSLGITQYTRSGNTTSELIGKGEAALSIGFAHQCTKARQEGYPELEVIFPQDGTGYEIGAVAMVAGARSETAARHFIDWVLTPAGQGVPVTANWFLLPTNSEAPVPEQSFTNAKLIDYDIEAAGAARTSLAERYTAEIAPRPEN